MIHYPEPQPVPGSLLQDRLAPGQQLWALGDLGLLEARTLVAVVGTREPSPDGVRRAARVARELVRAGVVVVSGLARGVDTAAHRAAIEAGGRTIAVLGTPLNRTYPPENADLLRLIEAPSGQDVLPSNFARRNRTMARISNATVIVEAGEGTGTISMGRDTLRFGRPLFILRPDAEHQGLRPLLIITRGGRCLSSAAELLDALRPGRLDALQPAPLALAGRSRC